MKNSKKLFSGLLTLGFLMCSVVACKAKDAPMLGAQLASVRNNNLEKSWEAADFADEDAIDDELLRVTLTQSTTTDNSQLYNINFKAKSNIGFSTRTNNFIVQINDENFSGDIKNPIKEDVIDTFDSKYTIVDENGNEMEVPMFNAVVSFIYGPKKEDEGSLPNKKIYIPTHVIRQFGEKSFVMNVTAISEGAVSEKGSLDFDKNNTWTYKKSGKVLPRINEIFIPNTIHTIEANAFTGVPEDVIIHYEGLELPANCDENWTDAKPEQIEISEGNFKKTSVKTGELVEADRDVNVSSVNEDIGDPESFIVGYKPNDLYPGEEYIKPLVVEYKSSINGGEAVTKYKQIDVASPRNNYDGVGGIGSLTFARSVVLDLAEGEVVDDSSVIVHNIFGIIEDDVNHTYTINPAEHYYAKPAKGYTEKTNLGYLVSVDQGSHSTFCGFTRYSFYLNKNLKYKSAAIPEEHSYYLDVKGKIYENNKISIDKGETYIRYSLYNLYKASYRFYYVSNGVLKKVDVPVTLPSGITYQTLDKTNSNLVSCLVKDSEITALAPDFATNKVVKFEVRDLTIQMDLFKSAGTATIIGKSAIAFTFGSLIAFDYGTSPKAPFNFNLLVGIFTAAFIAGYAALAVGLYFYLKNKYKNDEFRRVNKKKFIKSALIGGLGATILALAILFIIMRFTGFRNTIITFNPADPFVIIFAIAGIIAFGYFVVVMVKMIKAEKERRKHIRLRLDEDVQDDGTN